MVGEPKLTELETGRWTGDGRVGVMFSSASRKLVSNGMPNGDAGGGPYVDGDESGPPPGDVGENPGMVGESPSNPPPNPSPPWVRTGGILRPESFWKPRSLVLDEDRLLAVAVVIVELRQRFMKAGAK